MRPYLAFLVILLFLSFRGAAQNLDELLKATEEPSTTYATATFKATRIINGHSIERMKKGQLDVRISHRFGPLSGGVDEFFGMDQALTHLSLEYGITDWVMMGIGRGTFEKTVDGFSKFSILRQSSGARNMPVHLSYFVSTEIITADIDVPDQTNYFSSRVSYVHQVLVARKFSDKFSLQLTPTFVHRNMVDTEIESNDLWSMGIGTRYKLSKRISLNFEYYYVYRPNSEFYPVKYYNPLSIGVDIETGGHVFQLMLTNSRQVREAGFIGKTTGSWQDGDISLGFNISRVFSFSK